MAEYKLAIIAALITERPLCSECICTKADIPPASLPEYFARLERAIVVNEQVERCRGCGRITTVFDLLPP